MRTRARATLSPPAEPIVGSKRSKEDAATPSVAEHLSAQATPVHDSKDAIAKDQQLTVETPRKAKRVRFSDPGPSDYERIEQSQSTGLTPYMRKARLGGTPTRLVKSGVKQRRRATLPPRLELSSPVQQSVDELQFVPLREALSERTRRRLRRNHMSEEMNVIEAEQRELKRLRNQEEASDRRVRELMWELESQRQLGIHIDEEEEERVNALQAELQCLRDAMSEHQDRQVADAITAFEEYATSSDGSIIESVQSPSSPLDSERPSPPVDPVDCRPRGGRAVLEQAVARLTKEAHEAKSGLETVRAELQHLGFACNASEPGDILEGLRQSFRTARLELEYVLPGETPGGFEDGRLLLALVSHVRNLSKLLKSSESGRNQHQQSESALRGQFNKCLERAEHLENRLTILEATRIELTSRLKAKQQLIKDLELAGEARRGLLKQKQDELDTVKDDMASREKRNAELEEEAKTQTLSMDKLKVALASYRDEIAKLEGLVTEMDESCTAAKAQTAEHEADMAAMLLLRSEADERLETEKAQHAHTRGILATLQADIEKANEHATIESKRDSGAFCL